MDPFAVLAIEETADDEAVRAAYVHALRTSPPDRDPEGFRRIRAAYEALRDTESRLALRLFGPPPWPTLRSFLTPFLRSAAILARAPGSMYYGSSDDERG